MKRHFTTGEALEEIMRPATSSETQVSDTSSSSSSEIESDVDFMVESEHCASSSSSPDLSTKSGEHTPETATEWTARSGQVWSPSNEETTHYVPAATGLIPGPTRYAITRISDLESCFDLFFMADIIDIIVKMTNLNGRRAVRNWSDIDETCVKAYIGLLILAGVYRSKGESTYSLWDDHSGRAIFRATMNHTKF